MTQGTRTLFWAGASLFLGLLPALQADDLAYVTTQTQAFGVIDLNTGVFTQTGQSGAYLNGLGEFNNVLYGASSAAHGGGSTNTLYRIDPTNGNLTPVGNTSISISQFGSTPAGLFATASDGLYSIDPGTGAATFIGSPAITLGTTAGLSVGADHLYFMLSGLTSSILYSMNTATGALAPIGESSPGVCLKGMAFENGTLYDASGFCNAGSELFTVNPENGSTQFVADVSGFDDANGIAPLLSTPEPNQAWLVLVGLIALLLLGGQMLAKWNENPVCVHGTASVRVAPLIAKNKNKCNNPTLSRRSPKGVSNSPESVPIP